MPSYRNISFATVGSVIDILDHGSNVVVHGKATRELMGRLTTLERPLERYLFLPKRHNDVFAQFAETMWVLAGRDDVVWLSRYLPRAPDYSDDGRTWHAAYGPRLRRWAGDVDQLDKVRRLLTEDRESRRGVMVLFDPARDFVDSKDIPCNNWLSWIARDSRLHLSVAVRSNDAMWGFSGTNAFEWSILQELMAYWLKLEVGGAISIASYICSVRRAESGWMDMSKPMTKSELINQIAERSELKKGEVKSVMEALADVGYKELKKNSSFVVPGFAKFVVIKKPATKERKGINPFTKEPTIFKAKPARKIIRARPVKAAKDAV